MPTISIINQKGGTGKTTTAVNLSAGLARAGFRTLLIDLDPQAHATYGLGIDLEDLDSNIQTIANVLSEEHGRLGEIILDSQESNLKVAPSDIRLARTAAILHTRNFRENVLARALEPVRGQFAYVIIDCQPSLDVLSINALVASDKLLIPTELSGYSLRGFADLLATIKTIKGDQPGFDYRVLLTKITGLAVDRQQKAWKILEPIQDKILKTQIRRTEAIERSQMESGEEAELTPVILQEKWNKGARDYRAAVKEIIQLWPA
jgi:chromosome partitioning protein